MKRVIYIRREKKFKKKKQKIGMADEAFTQPAADVLAEAIWERGDVGCVLQSLL